MSQSRTHTHLAQELEALKEVLREYASVADPATPRTKVGEQINNNVYELLNAYSFTSTLQILHKSLSCGPP